MKRYEELHLELTQIQDVIATSGNVTTGGIQLPWEKKESLYELNAFNNMYPHPEDSNYNI